MIRPRYQSSPKIEPKLGARQTVSRNRAATAAPKVAPARCCWATSADCCKLGFMATMVATGIQSAFGTCSPKAIATATGRRHGAPQLPADGPRPRDGCDHRDQHEQHRFLRLTRRSALPGPIRSRPVLRPLLASARSPRTSRCGPSARRQRQHNRHPGRSPRIRTTNFPLRPPRLRCDLVDGDGFRLLEQAHPDRPASYAVRVPQCRDSPRASFPPRLTTTQLPPARS